MDELAATPGACPLELPAGQVLLYEGHLAPGVFVVLAGSLETEGGSPPAGLPAAAPEGTPLVLPRPESLEFPVAATVLIAEDASVLYLPRSVVRESRRARELLTQLADRAG